MDVPSQFLFSCFVHIRFPVKTMWHIHGRWTGGHLWMISGGIDLEIYASLMRQSYVLIAGFQTRPPPEP